MRNLIDFFVRQHLFGVLIAIFVVVIGALSAYQIRRERFPNVSFDFLVTSTTFPGASAEEVEQLITNPLERDMKEIDGIKELTSHSVESQSSIVLQLDPDATTEEKAKSELRDIIDRFKPDLPDGAEDPLITSLESKKEPIIEVHVIGDLSPLELRKEAKKLKDELELVPNVASVNADSLRDLEVRVETDLKRLKRYHVSLSDVVNALKKQNVSIPGGTIEMADIALKQTDYTVRTTGKFYTLDEIGNTVVRANELGTPIRVKDIANLSYDLEKSKTSSMTNGKPSIALTVLKKEGADGITLVDDILAFYDDYEPKLRDGVSVEFINDVSYYIRRRLKILTTNLLVGLFFVAIVLSLLLPGRIAAIVSLGIPFSFFGTVAIFYSNDYSINLISLIGLIIVSGMLVDDAVVVTDNCVRHLENGDKDAQDAVIEGTHEIWLPVTASVMTTVVVFLPLMFMSGIFGKFVQHIPLGVIIALLISLVEAFFVLPSHIGAWINAKKLREKMARKKGRFQKFWDKTVLPKYVILLRTTISHRYLTAFGCVVFVGFSLFVGYKTKFILFPSDDIDIFIVRGQAPVGSDLETTSTLMKPIEQYLLTLPKNELVSFRTTGGAHMQGLEVLRRGSEYIETYVFLTEQKERDRHAREIINAVRDKFKEYDGFERLTFEQINPGPPVGRPISLEVRGKEYPEIKNALKALREKVQTVEGVTDLNDTYILGKKEFSIKVDPVRAAATGISVTDVGSTVRAAFEGLVATTINKLDEEIDVRVSLSKSERSQGETIQSLKVANPAGYLIPLTQVATISEYQGLADYEHKQNRRQIKLLGEVDENIISARAANNTFRKFVPEISEAHPNVSIHFGGEDKDTTESMISLGRAFLMAIMSVLLILVLTFRRLLQPLVIFMVTIPMAIAAAIWAFFVHGMPLTFMGLMGLIALGGVAVNNAIVFVDFANKRRERGSDRFDSLLEAGRARLRPIFLTTVTTSIGLMPTSYGIGGLDPFVTYITVALSWGLIFGSVFIQIALPTALAILDDMTLFVRKLIGRESKELVIFGAKPVAAVAQDVPKIDGL